MVQTSPTPFDVGRAFVHQYYTLLHQAPHLLHRFYSTDSTFIHGGVDRPGCVEQPAVGPEHISQRINELNLRDCHAKIRQVDSHPTIGDGVVVQVTGELSNNGDPMRRFMQTFVLAPRQPKKYYVQNDIFRYQDEVFDEGSDEVDEDDRSSSHIYGDTTSNADKVSNADSSAATSKQPLLMTATTRSSMEEHQPLPPRNNLTTLGSTQSHLMPIPVIRQQDHQHTDATNLNGFSNPVVDESSSYDELDGTHLQTQQQQQQHETVQSYSQSSSRFLDHQISDEKQQQFNNDNVSNQQQVKQMTITQQQPTSTTTEGPRTEGTSYAGIAKLHSSTGSTTNMGSNSLPVQRNGSTSSGIPSSNLQHSNTIRSLGKAPLTTANRQNSNSQTGQQRSSGANVQQYNRMTAVTAPNERQVFVGSLPLDFTKETLIECFSKYGNVVDATIHTPMHDNRKNFGFVVFDTPEVATNVVSMEHIMYNDTIRLNVEPKTQRHYTSHINAGSNSNNGQTAGGRNSNYQGRGSGRGGNRTSYRNSGANQRRAGGQFNSNVPLLSGGDENNNEFRTAKSQQQIHQQ